MAQHGSGHRRSSRDPDAGQRDREDRPQKPERGRRAARAERPPWDDAFSSDTDPDLPSWAEPASYRPGHADTRVRRTPAGPPRHGYADPDDGRGPGASSVPASYGDPYGPADASEYRDTAGYQQGDRGGVGYQERDDQLGAGEHGETGSYHDGAPATSDDYLDDGSNQDQYRRQSSDTREAYAADSGRPYSEAEPGYADRDRSVSEPEPQNEAPGRLARRGRAAAARLRKSRRRVYRLSTAAIVVAVLVAGGWILFGQPKHKPLPYVTTLQAGEFKSVPNACAAVGAEVLNKYLPEPGRTTTQEQADGMNSQCSFTIDKKPTFLVLEVSAVAYEPFAAASGDGSATHNAQDNFKLTQQGLVQPLPKSPFPPAVITPIPKFGQQAFSAFQREHVTGIVTYVASVIVRERNVLVTVTLSGQQAGHGFGPVSQAALAAGARAAADNVLAKVQGQPTA